MKAKFNPQAVDAADLVGCVIRVSDGQYIVRAHVIACNGSLDGTLFLVEQNRWLANAGKVSQKDIFSCKQREILGVDR